MTKPSFIGFLGSVASVLVGLSASVASAQPTKVGSPFVIQGSLGYLACYGGWVAGKPNDGFVVTYNCRTQPDDIDNDYGKVYDKSATVRRNILGMETPGQWGTSVASAESGRFLVAWAANGPKGKGQAIYAKPFIVSGIAASNEFVVSATSNGAIDPSVTALADGSYLVGWTSIGTNSTYAVAGQRINPNGKLIGGKFQLNNTPTSSPPAAVAGLAKGGFVAVWPTSAGAAGQVSTTAGQRVVNARFNLSGCVGPSGPSVAALPGGGFVVVCARSGGGILGQRYSRLAAPGGGPFTIDGSAFDSSPQVASLTGGGFVVVWAGYENPYIFAQLYDPNALPVGNVFRVDTPTSGDYDMSHPWIAPLSSGGFVVTWTVFYADESTALKGQRFAR